jgi:transposase
MSNINTTSSSNFPESNKGMHYETRCSDRVKLLAWDGSGMVLVTKWLQQGRRFTWPPIRDGAVHLSATQLAILLDGYDWTQVSPKPVRQPTLVG